jgi:di/tricarboxylate transporter
MSLEIIIVLVIILAAVILFITETIPIDLVAISAMSLLLITGILSPEEALRGFGDDATITIAAMFILSAGLFRTGLISYIGRDVVKLFHKNFWLAIILMMLLVGILSGFINNTPIVAIFLPVLLQVSRETDISASKLLMPLSFASIFGGICTLIGTSTNIVVSSITVQYGQPAFSMFEFTHLGLLFFAAGIIYMIIFGIPILSKKKETANLTGAYNLNNYLTEIIIQENSSVIGSKIKDSTLYKNMDIDILEIIRGDERIFLPSLNETLREKDILRVKCNIENIKEIQEKEGIILKAGSKQSEEEATESKKNSLIEAVIAPHSVFIGKTLKQINFKGRFNATALAIRHRGRVMNENISTTKLIAGDALIIEINEESLERLKSNQSFVVISEVETPTFIKAKIAIAVTIIAGVVITATTGIFPIVVSALIGAVLLVITRCISLEHAYRSVDWQIILLLAGSFALGTALEKTGAARLLSENIISIFGSAGNFAILSIFYIITLVLTEVMSNNATAVLITPIALVTAASLGVDPRPFLITVMFAASLAFMSPVGYQTHLLIYNPGRYKYLDFLKVGTPLNILFWLMATFLIPMFFPF